LESKHKSTANQAIRVWNSTFGLSKQTLEYPDRVKDALLRLRPLADLQLPFFPESLESEDVSVHRQPVEFAESQDDSRFLPTTSMESVLKKHRTPLPGSSKVHNSTPQVVIPTPSSGSRKRSREETLQTGKRKSRKQDSTPKLRHQDSQIHFAAVDSSPIPGTIQYSQVLTERQKEVKERQQAEAAMFPDLWSSPKPKEKAVVQDETAEPELPLHRSSSRSRTRSPLRAKQIERQTTPTPLPPSEDDNFMVSSPTPKRSSQPHVDPSAVPSSPPEAIIKEQPVIAATEPAIPSSPPEMTEEPEFEQTTSVEYPSAQVDPYAIEIDRTVSTFGSTHGQKSNAFVDGDAAQLETSKENQASIDGGVLGPPLTFESADEPQTKSTLRPVARDIHSLGDEPPTSSPVDVEMTKEHSVGHEDLPQQTEAEPPSTPSRRTRSHDTKPDDEQLSSPLQFVDALTSPASSEKHTVNEEIFEDAVSSPRLVIDTTHKKLTSSPLSDLDESSIMRMMKGYDEGSGRAPDTSPGRQTRAASKFPSQAAVFVNPSSPRSIRKAALINATAIQTGQTPGPGNKRTSAIDEAPQSSLPSLIPETPAPKAPSTSNKIIAEGEEFDPDDTIVVDASALEDMGKVRVIKSKGRRGRKRKLEESPQEAEVPDSQEGQAPGACPIIPYYVPKTNLLPAASSEESTRKKSRGRKKKSSQSQSSQLSQEVEDTPNNEVNHSFASVDLDSSMQTNLLDDTSKEPEVNMMEAIKPDATDAASENGNEVSGTDDQLPTAVNNTEASLEEEMPTDKHSSLENPASTEVEMVEETTIDDSGLIDTSHSPSHELDIAPKTVNDDAPAVDPISTSSPAADSDEQPRSPSPTMQKPEVKSTAIERVESPAPSPKTSSPKADDQPDDQDVEVSSFQNQKNTLSGLIDYLRTAALSKDQVSEIEDLLDHTKEKLYGAKRRGRQAGM
jgi:hypothetical protein